MKKIERIFDFIYNQKETNPLENCLVDKQNGIWKSTSTEDYINKALILSKFLLSLGLQKGDKVALISSNNRSEWNICDIAMSQIGVINVPLYPTISSKDYKYIFNEAEIKYCFVSDLLLFEKVNEIYNEVKSLKGIFSFDKIDKIQNIYEILNMNFPITNDKIFDIKENISKDDICTIIYTSGTTGNPKGVVLSHWNIVSNVLNCVERVPVNQNAKVISFLPLCHVFERLIIYLYQYLCISIYYAESLDTIGDNIREVKPEMFTAVPRLIEKVYSKILNKGKELKGIKRLLFFWAVNLAKKYELKNSIFYNFQLMIARKLIFSKWKEALGGNVKVIVSGSAALEQELIRIFIAAGIPILEGYGLSETSPVIAVNSLDKNCLKIGTVGKPISNCEVKIADNGEIIVRGPNVMQAYYKNPELTAQTINSDGWLHTGDKGEFVGDNFLKITGRIKQIFKTSGGKYISPELMENKFKLSEFIDNIIVIGEGKKFPSAIIILNKEKINSWADIKKIESENYDSLITNKLVINKIYDIVNHYNKEFGNWEQIKKINIVNDEWTVENNTLSPTLKLKRNIILDRYKNIIEEIYNVND